MTDAVETTDAVEEVTDEVEQDEEEQEQEDPTVGLKTALAKERKLRRDAEKKARDATDALSVKDKPADEQAVELARREAAAEATKGLSERIVKAEVKAALGGRVNDPARVLSFIDVSDIELGDDGEVDGDAVADAVEKFLTDYPEFKSAGRGAGSADQFSKGRQPKPEKANPNDLIRAAFQKS